MSEKYLSLCHLSLSLSLFLSPLITFSLPLTHSPMFVHLLLLLLLLAYSQLESEKITMITINIYFCELTQITTRINQHINILKELWSKFGRTSIYTFFFPN